MLFLFMLPVPSSKKVPEGLGNTPFHLCTLKTPRPAHFHGVDEVKLSRQGNDVVNRSLEGLPTGKVD